MANIREFLNFGNHLADNSRKISLKFFKKRLVALSKSNKKFDPVTEADTSIQKYINNSIKKKFPSHSIIGEEGSQIQNNEYEWCIDPIDGTRSFITGFPTWGTLISLSYKNKVLLGIVDMPVLNERYIAYDKFAYKITNNKKKKLKTKKNNDLSKSILSSTSVYEFKTNKDNNHFDKIAKRVAGVHFGGDCYQYCLLADGLIDIIIESGLNSWDIRALIPIIKNSGGSIKTWENQDPKNGGRIIAANNKILLNKTQSLLLK
ncbi:inositol monophosphatase [Pelagibacteraceae bacterium]|nr:inositol monophosphatase [Pelagibacteraceae bacterium]